MRLHATTGLRPVDLLEKERPSLTPLGVVAPYQIIRCVQRTVDAEALVRFENVRYSMPAFHAGARVAIEAFGSSIRSETFRFDAMWRFSERCLCAKMIRGVANLFAPEVSGTKERRLRPL